MDWQTAREEILRQEDVQRMVAERAYSISESRGFQPGNEMEDWLTAENEVVEQLLRERAAAEEGRTTEPAAAMTAVGTSVSESATGAENVAGTESDKPATEPGNGAKKRATTAKSATPKAGKSEGNKRSTKKNPATGKPAGLS